MSIPMTNIEAAALRNEHTSLNAEVDEWKQWWGELNEMGDPHLGEMGDRLSQFRDHLAAHFAHEENQGWLSMTMEFPAELVEHVAELRDEHSHLLQDLDSLILQLQQCEPGIDCWGEARQRFEDLLDRLNAHENSEDALWDRLS